MKIMERLIEKAKKLILLLLMKKELFFLLLFLIINLFFMFDILYSLKNINNFIIYYIIYNFFVLILDFILIIKLENKINLDNLTKVLRREKIFKNFKIFKKFFDKMAIIFIDLDNFKYINDTAGHDIGDEVLKKVGNILIKNFKSFFVYRLGGDEFIAILPFDDEEKLKEKLNKISEELNIEIKYNDHIYKISATIGVVLYPEHSTDINELIKKADIAMYEKKQKDKNGVLFYSYETEHKKKNKIRIKKSLEKVLFYEGKDDYKLDVFLQPQINKKGILKGAEALIRFKFSDKLDYLLPNEFLEVAYENNLIFYIDLFVMEKICQKMREWMDKGYPLFLISVNLTFKNLENDYFISSLIDIVDKYNIPKKYIGLEITEETLIKNFIKSKEIVIYLKRLGFYLSIDDFGTGYSNYMYIKDFPFDKLKIDKKFVSSLPSYKDEVILKSIMILARGFNLETIAEGVETQEQLEILKEIGIDQFQGYYFDKPLEISEFEKKYLKKK